MKLSSKLKTNYRRYSVCTASLHEIKLSTKAPFAGLSNGPTYAAHAHG